MFAILPSHLHEYSSIQVAVSNGSEGPYVIRPEDFTYVRDGSTTVRATPARTVISMLQHKGSGSDVIKLAASYEAAVYGNLRLRSTTNGYEQRRLAALSMGSTRLKAAATASALAMVQTETGSRRIHRWRGILPHRGQASRGWPAGGEDQHRRV